MKNQMNKFISFSIMTLMLLSMVSATYATEGQTQEVVATSSGTPVYVGDTQADTVVSSGAFSGTLREGQTTHYYYNDEKYELTLVWVSDAQYWEENTDQKTTVADDAPALDNRPSAKFAINGEVTNGLHPGEKDATRCGTIIVKEIGNSVTASGDQGSASYTFYPKSCTLPPPPSDYVKLEEGQEQNVFLNNQKYEIKLVEATPKAAAFEVTSNSGETSVRVLVGNSASTNGLTFKLRDASYDWALIGDFSSVSSPNIIKDSLREGESHTYMWNGMEYDLTLIFVSDPVYWEESGGNVAETADSISNRPTAKFLLNGEVTDAITVGGYGLTACGRIKVERIDTTGRDNTTERDGGVGFTFWPQTCNSIPPPTSNTNMHIIVGKNAPTSDVLDAVDLSTALQNQGYKTEVTYSNVTTDKVTPIQVGITLLDTNAYKELTEAELTEGVQFVLYKKHALLLMGQKMGGDETRMAEIAKNHLTEDGFRLISKRYPGISRKYILVDNMMTLFDQQQACTQEAKICPDGSAVGRNPNNNCVFDSCPSTNDNKIREECEASGGQWSCSETASGDVGGCDCYLANTPNPEEPQEPQPDTECVNGCLKGDRCLPYGTRLANGEAVYCSINNELQTQLEDGTACQNSYECVSNQCLNAKCQSLDKEIKNTQSLLNRILGWFGLA